MNRSSPYVVVDRNAAPSQVKRRILYSIAIAETDRVSAVRQWSWCDGKLVE